MPSRKNTESGRAETRSSLKRPAKYMIFDLFLALGFAVVALVAVYIPNAGGTTIQSSLSQVIMLFVPGYSLAAALFPGRKDLDGIERILLSFGISIILLSLVGLGLTFTPWGLHQNYIAILLTAFTLICVLMTSIRRHDLSPEDSFRIYPGTVYRNLRSAMFPGQEGAFDKVFTIIVIAAISVLIISIAYVFLASSQGSKFTEMYLLGPDGKATNYPTRFVLGQSKPVIVGVANHEYQSANYTLIVALKDNSSLTQLSSQSFTVADNQTLEQTIQLKPDRVGDEMKTEFLLYKDGNMTAPYRSLQLSINVTG
ncbi:MAG TPA: DUF1616 domain-containing protein [Methanocella sp.]|nr:DUF1616 domain-containing protein [Methanocella sp.]